MAVTKKKVSKKASAVEKVDLVKTVVMEMETPNGTKTADVHPLEVDNYSKSGWSKV